MINISLSALAILMLFCGAASSQEIAGSGNRTLVVYFSKSGNTRALAEQIHGEVGGDLFQITTVKAYPEEYRPTTEVAKVERDNNERPELQSYVENMNDYDTIFLGFPNWWNTMPMALYTFLEHHNLSGKTIAPFMTHGGGGVQRCEEDLRKTSPNSTILPILSVSGSMARDAKGEVSEWLRSINLAR